MCFGIVSNLYYIVAILKIPRVPIKFVANLTLFSYGFFFQHTAGLTEVIIYSSPDDKKKNRGFCFLEYESHKAASLAKRRLSTGRIKVWGCDIIVDWADPQEEPDEQTMSKVNKRRIQLSRSNSIISINYASL